MSELHDYQDARTLHPDYAQHRCPSCGTLQWFKRSQPDTGRTLWYCQDCSTTRNKTLEYPCPECGVRMISNLGNWHCQNDVCDHDITEHDKEALIQRLSGCHHLTDGMPGVHLECPVCRTHETAGTPDGDIRCDNCQFYVGQYTGEWYCYAIWKDDPGVIRVNKNE